jgi:hypothetical protein
MQDFTTPQPFNVEIGPEQQVTPHEAMPVLGPAVPVVAQEITRDADLYPVQRYGVRRGVVR